MEAYAFGEMVDRVAILREFNTPFVDSGRGMLGVEDCGSLLIRLRSKESITEKYGVRRPLGKQQPLVNREMDNVFWLPGTGNLAGGSAKVKSDTIPLSRMLQLGFFCPGALRRLTGAPFQGSESER